MFGNKPKSLVEGIDIDDVKADRKSAKRVGQFKISNNAIYKADGTYLPLETVTEYTHDKTSVHVSGCCAGGVPVERLILDTADQRFPFLFDRVKDVEKVIDIVEKKLKNTILIIALMTAVSFSGCGSKPATISTDALTNTNGESSNMETNQIIKVDDLLVTTDWIGKTKKELKIDTDSTEKYYNIEGLFFGNSAGGSCSFNSKNADGEPMLSRVSFSVKKCSLGDIYDELMETYGGPIDEGMEPYAESNGGAVEWYSFDAGEAIVKISQGSEVDYVLVEIVTNPNPSNIGKLVIKIPADTNMSESMQTMGLKVVDYSDGKLTVEISNQTEDVMTYTDEFILAKSSDGGQTYAHLKQMGSLNIGPADPEEYTINPSDVDEFICDLRCYGKIEAGKYMIIIDDMQAEFQLVPEGEDEGGISVAPWFCPNCGRKNIDTLICTECGAQKE